jgi:hypothetical protein
MISLRQTIESLNIQASFFKHLLSTLRPEDKEYELVKQNVEALNTALFFLEQHVPKPPVYSPYANTYTCCICGCLVGFQVAPGVRCCSCPQCSQSVDWSEIDFN